MSIGSFRFLLAIFLVAAIPTPYAHADAIFNVTLDTSPLTVSPGAGNGPFSLFFQLTDGSGLGDGNNTVTLTNFDFGGGSFLGPPDFTGGGVTGDLASGITLTDVGFFNFFQQGFTPGASLSFDLSMTTNLNGPGLPPDLFAFSILPILTTDPIASTLLTINIDSAAPLIESFGSDPQSGIVLNAPHVTAVPEPASLLLMSMGLGAMGLLERRRRRRQTT